MELLGLSIEDLEEVLGNGQAAQELFESLHDKVKPVQDSKNAMKKGPKRPGGKGSRFKTAYEIKKQ